MTHEERLQRVAQAISGAPFPSLASLRKAKAAIAASDATLEVSHSMVLAAYWASYGQGCTFPSDRQHAKIKRAIKAALTENAMRGEA